MGAKSADMLILKQKDQSQTAMSRLVTQRSVCKAGERSICRLQGHLEAVLIPDSLGEGLDLLDKGLRALLHDISPDVCP